MKMWDSTQIYNSGRILGATDKDIATKARYLSTPKPFRVIVQWELGPNIAIVEIQDDIVYKHSNLYPTGSPRPGDKGIDNRARYFDFQAEYHFRINLERIYLV
jgi:hypothetical protein